MALTTAAKIINADLIDTILPILESKLLAHDRPIIRKKSVDVFLFKFLSFFFFFFFFFKYVNYVVYLCMYIVYIVCIIYDYIVLYLYVFLCICILYIYIYTII